MYAKEAIFELRTLLELLLFKVARESRCFSLVMEYENVKPHTTIMTFNRERSRFVLNRKVVPDSS